MFFVLMACSEPVKLGTKEPFVPDLDSDSTLTDIQDTDSAPPVDCGEIPADDVAYADLFDATRVHSFALTVAEGNKTALALQPGDWVRADVVVDGHDFPGVGIKWRGDADQQRWDGKPGFRIGFREMRACETYAGLSHLSLDAQIGDAVQGRQVLESAILAGAGQVASRATWATVTVNGEDFGLYSHLEVIDDAFLLHHGLAAGVLWEGNQGADFTSENLDNWSDTTDVGDTTSLEQLADIVQGSEDDFYAQADTVLNMDAFLTRWAFLAAMGDMGSYPYVSDDVYLYVSPEDGRLTMFSWSEDNGWAEDFGWNFVDTGLGLRCVYDPICSDAFKVHALSALDSVDALGIDTLSASLFDISDASLSADPRRGTSAASVRQAREALLLTQTTWADLIWDGP